MLDDLYNVHIMNITTANEDLEMKAPKVNGIEFNSVTDISYKADTQNKDWEAAGIGNLRNFYTEHLFRFKTPEGYIIKEVVMVKIDD